MASHDLSVTFVVEPQIDTAIKVSGFIGADYEININFASDLSTFSLVPVSPSSLSLTPSSDATLTLTPS